MQILFEDNHLLAVAKPPGLITQGAAEGVPSVVEWARQSLKERYHKPGNVYVGVVSRLDAHASGVVLLARTSRAAAAWPSSSASARCKRPTGHSSKGIPLCRAHAKTGCSRTSERRE